MYTTVSPPPFHERRPMVRRRFRIKRETEPPNTSLVRLGGHVISHPHARSGPVNTLGPYLVHLPRITVGLLPKERKIFTKPQQVAASTRRWMGDYHPSFLRELGDLIPIEMLTARQRTNTTAVVAAATALIFAYQAKEVPLKVDTPVLKDMVKYLESYIPRRFFHGKQGTRMELFLRGIKRFLMHLSPKNVIHLDNEDGVDALQGSNSMAIIKVEDTENMSPLREFDKDDIGYPSAPPRSRKRNRDDTDERPTKRARPGQPLSSLRENFHASHNHPNTETAGMKQLLELAGLGTSDVDQCLRWMAQGMSAKRAMAELGKDMRLPV